MIWLDYQMLETLRRGKELSQTALAKKAGIARATVNRLEQGQADAVTFATVNQLAVALGVDANTFVKFERAEDLPNSPKQKRAR